VVVVLLIGGCHSLKCTQGKVCGITPATSLVKFSISGANRVITSNGCPGYNWTSETTPDKATAHCNTFTFPLTPTICVGVQDVGLLNTTSGKKLALNLIVKGGIGVSINGAQIYGSADANGKDAYINEGSTFDTCGGHPDPTGIYHYHADPKPGCVYNNIKGKHSPLWGFMADGIPIFGAYGDKGVVPKDLDKCGGHVDKSYPFYHYHVTYNYKYPYTVACLHGKISKNTGFMNLPVRGSTCVAQSTQYDYSSIKNYQPTKS